MLTAMLDRKYRGRRKGVPIREGSVREARHDAGLSLAQVAGEEVSRTAIHLIEHGRTRPSFETLQQIARRTRKPLEFFLLAEGVPVLTAAQRELRKLEQLTVARDFESVITLGVALLGKRWNRNDTALINFYLGQAYCRLVRPDEALGHLRPARAHFEQVDDEWMAVEAMDWEASALGLQEDPEAIPLATEALERCRKLDPAMPQTQTRILGHIASMYVVAHAWTQAVRHYHAAVDAAGSVKDMLQEAKMHHGLALAYQRMLRPAEARKHFDKALALYSIEADPSAVYRVENDLGHLLLEEGHLDAAEQHLVKALAGCDELRIDRRARGYILNNLGHVNLRRGELRVAADCFRRGLEVAVAVGERIVQAEAHSLLAQVAELEGRPREADQHFETALMLVEQIDMPDRLRDSHMQYAELLEARGEIASAARHWRIAAEVGKLAAAGIKWSDGRSALKEAGPVA